MNRKSFYILGGSLAVIIAVLYFTKNKAIIVKKEERVVTGGQSATIPPMEAPTLRTPPLVGDVWLTLKGIFNK
jgi:hypothetical protein